MYMEDTGTAANPRAWIMARRNKGLGFWQGGKRDIAMKLDSATPNRCAIASLHSTR
jgi:hypothetical protein